MLKYWCYFLYPIWYY